MKERKKAFCLIIIIVFVLGVLVGNSFDGRYIFNNGLSEILDIDQWEVKKVYRQNEIIYESNGKRYVDKNQENGWRELLNILTMKGYIRFKTEGDTAHLKYEIEMENGDIYYIEYLGCQNQVDITYPSGIKVKYYGYN